MTLGSPETSARPADETAHQPVTFPVTARTLVPHGGRDARLCPSVGCLVRLRPRRGLAQRPGSRVDGCLPGQEVLDDLVQELVESGGVLQHQEVTGGRKHHRRYAVAGE